MDNRDPIRKAANVFLCVAIFCFIVLVARLCAIVLERKAEGLKNYDDPLVASSVVRGNITDRNGNLLAIQTTQYLLYFRLDRIENLDAAAALVSPYIAMDYQAIIDRCGNYTTMALIKRSIREQTAKELNEAIKAAGMEGQIILTPYDGRIYPSSFHASQLVGFVGTDNHGLEGVEYAFDDYLMPYPALGEEITYGADIELTIDLDIQYLLDVQVQSIVYESDPDYIMALVMDAQSGEVLASSSYPWYDPNSYNLASANELLNRNLTYTYEPGSVFKIFTLAAAMENNVDTKTAFYCDGSADFTYHGQTFTINCHEPHGYVDAELMIAKSCNGAIASWALQIDDELFYEFLSSLGFGKKLDAGLSGVASGTLREPSLWSARSKATLAFGQELSVNALQICAASTAIARDGVMISPSFIKNIKDHNGDALDKKESAEKRVMSEETARQIREYMVSAVTDGTARLTKVDGLLVGAKTGTAELVNEKSGRYEDGASLASCLAIAPADNPQYIVYFAVSAPRGDSIWGANVAAPSCGALFRGLASQGKLKTDLSKVIYL